MRFLADGGRREEQVKERVKCANIARLCKGQAIVFYIDFGRVGFGAPRSVNRKWNLDAVFAIGSPHENESEGSLKCVNITLGTCQVQTYQFTFKL